MTKQDKIKAAERKAEALRANLRRRKSGDAEQQKPRAATKKPPSSSEN